jgi:hypothetical protein
MGDYGSSGHEEDTHPKGGQIKYESIVVGIEEGIKRISKTRSSLET